MASVNEQSSPILDVEHGPVSKKQGEFNRFRSRGSALYNTFKEYLNLFFIFILQYVFRNFEIFL